MTPASRWTPPVEATTPPLDSARLEAILDKVRDWQPFNGDAVLDDVGAVLDDFVLPEESLDDHAQRLRGHSMRLVDIAVAAQAERKDKAAARLIDRARAVRSEEVPGDHRQAVGHLRRMAWSVNELLDLLVELGYTKEPDSLREAP
ncbi:DUF6415 family natural product biosynthesis protein [Streptomyces sp. NPDC051554]|uniref:DUF6415 family natural product biosynthesis protein n=1 Tax=Streptomyces sp. NPDC051554 TaxID=3365656 RepID=UPI0037B25463